MKNEIKETTTAGAGHNEVNIVTEQNNLEKATQNFANALAADRSVFK